jgi:hypothetical protein
VSGRRRPGDGRDPHRRHERRLDAATTQILNGPTGSEIGTAGFGQADAGDGDRMWNLAPLIPAERRFSRVYRGRPELIDHVCVSHLLAGRTTRIAHRGFGEERVDGAPDDGGPPPASHVRSLSDF